MSLSESYAEEKHKYMYFHGKDIRSKKFQKYINKKSNLSKVIGINILLIFGAIMILWLLTFLLG